MRHYDDNVTSSVGANVIVHGADSSRMMEQSMLAIYNDMYGSNASESLRDQVKREKEDLEITVTQLARKIADLTRQLDHMNRYPEDDPFVDGIILRFEKKFSDDDTAYTYFAARISGRWYLTGVRAPQNITWDELVEFMGLDVSEVYCVNATGTNGEQKVIG